MKTRTITIIIGLSLAQLFAAKGWAQVPGIINYQGRVSVSATNFDGNGQFQFALLSATNTARQATATATTSGGFVTLYTVTFGGTNYASAPAVTVSGGSGSGATATAFINGAGVVTNIVANNPGSGYTSVPTVTIAPPSPNFATTPVWSNGVSTVSLTVTKGLYSVLLGDTTVPNMSSSIPTTAFTNNNVVLRVFFNDGVHGLQQLSPDQRLGAVGYALNAAMAQTAVNLVSSSDVIGLRLNIGALNTLSGFCATIAGGSNNTASGFEAAVGGGGGNSANGSLATVGGGGSNIAGDDFATVGGGEGNIASGAGAFIGGGGDDGDTFLGNAASGNASTIGGGLNNNASGAYAFIGGGQHNVASNDFATVGGGDGNTAGGEFATAGGGVVNIASGQSATVGGGGFNTASGFDATVGGGGFNTANNAFATVPGGANNTAGGTFSFAAGHQAQALHIGAFVWADSQNAVFASTAPDQFCIRAAGGVQFQAPQAFMNFISTNASSGSVIQLMNSTPSNTTLGAINFYNGGSPVGQISYVSGDDSIRFRTAGSDNRMVLGSGGLSVNGTFVSSSDRNAKEAFAPVDGREVLNRVMGLPISSWNYKQDIGTRHIGPMAQDFYAAFNVGPDDKHIATVDEEGVALAAIQGLNQKLENQLRGKEDEIRELKARLERIEKRLEQVGQSKADVNDVGGM